MSSFFKFKKIIYVFILAVLGLCGCAGFSLVAEGGGYSLVVVHGLLVAVVSLVERGLYACWLQWALEHGLRSCGTHAQLLCSM